LNVQSLQHKTLDIEYFLKAEKIDLLCVGETWLTEYICNANINIAGYTFHRKDRSNGMLHGGVGMYIKSDLAAKRRPDLESERIEAVVLETGSGNEKLYVCSFYRRNLDRLQDFIDFVEQLIRKIENKPILLVGDVNVNFLDKRNINTVLLTTLFVSYGAKQFVREATRYSNVDAHNDQRSLIDIIVSNRPHLCVGPARVHRLYDKLSDHLPTTIVVKTKVERIPQHSHHSRDFKRANIDKFIEAISNVDFSFNQSETCSSFCSQYESTIQSIVDSCFPYIKFKTTDKHLPQLTPHMSEQIKLKYDLLTKMRRPTATREDRIAFNRQSNYVRRLSITVRRNHITEQIKRNENDSAHLWKVLRAQLPLKSQNDMHSIALNIDGALCNDQERVANALNEHFSSVGQTLATRLPQPTVDALSFVPHPVDTSSFAINPVTRSSILEYLAHIPLQKSIGDDVPFRILKQVAAVIAAPLADIVNKSFSEAQVSPSLKSATVTALFKAGERSSMNNYRPISVLPLAAKCLEHSINEQLTNFLLRKNMYKYQSAYKKGHSTEMALSFVTNAVYKYMEANEPVVLVFIDLSKAFDTIPHDILLQKLERYGIRGHPLTWFKSLLSDRSQAVKIRATLSTKRPVTVGIPQGSALGPTLFNLFMNDIEHYCDIPNDQIPPLLFADDTALIFSGKYVNSDTINSSLEKLKIWMISNRLTINGSKTKFMAFGQHPNLALEIDGEQIEQVAEFKYLGFILQSNLSQQLYIDSIVSKINKMNGIIYGNRMFLTSDLNERLVNALALPIVSYCDTLLTNVPPCQLSRLDTAYRKLLKNVYRLPLDFPTNLVYRRRFLPLILYRQINAATFCLKILTHNCAPYLHDLFEHITTRRRHTRAVAEPPRRYLVPRARTDRFKKSISFWGPNLLNSVSENLITTSLTKREPAKYFKEHYKTLLTAVFRRMVWSRELELSGVVLI
jgi:hypothetical protein